MASAAKSPGGKREEAEQEQAPVAAPKKSRGPLLLILASAVLSAALASGVTWFLAPKHAGSAKAGVHAAAEDGKDVADKDAADGPAKAESQEPALYLDLTPAFVVNLADEEAVRFLQVDVELMARDPKVVDAAKNHMPRIRNTLMLLLSQQHSHDIATREAKENLQKQALAEVQKALQEENAPAEVAAVYFTSFVIQ